MAVPKHKVSKSAKGMRRSHLRIKSTTVAECPNCGNARLPHRICLHCGHYKGKEIITTARE